MTAQKDFVDGRVVDGRLALGVLWYGQALPLHPGVEGFDHGVGHPLLLLYDAKALLGKNSNYFNGLWHNLCKASANP
jgi:hypothetical protein